MSLLTSSEQKKMYLDAYKEVAKSKAAGKGYMAIQLSYYTKIVLEHSLALEFQNLLAAAMYIEEARHEPPTIDSFSDKVDVSYYPMSEAKFRQIQVARLLGVPVESVPLEDSLVSKQKE